MWAGKKTDHGAWHYCQRSGIKSNLDDMKWEGGILVDPEFSDDGPFGMLGSRDADIARRLKDNTSDLQPHPKLSHPDPPDDDVYMD